MPLFSHVPGRVVALPQKHVVGSVFGVTAIGGGTGTPISFESHKTIITKIGVGMAGNYQFLHTLGNDVYVYVFGDRMGQIVLHCLSFAAACPEADNSAHGFNALVNWYRDNRIAASDKLIKVNIGNEVFQGFLVGSNPELSDPETKLVQTQLIIALLPEAS
jgi:hypothetical protein